MKQLVPFVFSFFLIFHARNFTTWKDCVDFMTTLQTKKNIKSMDLKPVIFWQDLKPQLREETYHEYYLIWSEEVEGPVK